MKQNLVRHCSLRGIHKSKRVKIILIKGGGETGKPGASGYLEAENGQLTLTKQYS